MRKYCLFVFIALLTIVSCGSNQIIYDDTVPEKETAIIQPSASIVINTFDGNYVFWKAGFSKGTKITIPAGEHKLTVGLISALDAGGVTHHGGNFLFSYNFEPGHLYFLRFEHYNQVSKELQLRLDDKTTGSKNDIKAYQHEE